MSSSKPPSADDLSLRAEDHDNWLYHPRFPQHWRRQSLYSMADWANGLAFRNIQFSDSGRPIIKIAEIKGGISGQTRFTNQTFDDSVRVCAGDLLFAWSGQPETSIDVYQWRGPEGWLNQHIFRVTPDPALDEMFFFYLLKSLKPNFVGIARNKQTTGLGHVTKRDLEDMEVGVPPLNEQRRIAHILGTLHDKIELNRRMSQTLEAMAQALFKSWFVDFDPVRAKAEGRPTGLPPHLDALFPDSFQDSELGEIPEGWRVRLLGDIAEERKRSVKPSEILPSTPYISLAHMPQRSIALSQWDTADGIESGKSAFRRGEILFGKLRPYFHKVAVAPVDGVCSTDIVVAAPECPEWFGFVLGHVSSTEFVDYTDAGSTGTRMPRTSWKHMAQYEIALPPCDLARAFTAHTHSLVETILCATHDSRTQGHIRDTVLPELMSGTVAAASDTGRSA
ncbi:MAG: restriction endonuclease subunit S [Chloroflexi bacterium]|nr:restriction endonuclease subunit S [Chloroflexota bacterium]